MSGRNLLPPPIRKLALYAVCGGSGVVLDLGVYTLLVTGGVWYQLANIAGYASGTILSFFLNRAITFRVKDAPMRRFLIFVAVAAFGFLVSSAVLWLMIELMAIDAIIAKVVTLVFVVAIQFSLNSLVTFRSNKTPRVASR